MTKHRVFKYFQTLGTRPLFLRGSSIVLVVFVFLTTNLGLSATFRNNPKVLYRPSICSALLGEFTDKNHRAINVEELLIDLTRKVYRQYQASHPEVLNFTPVQISEKIAAQHDKLMGRVQYNSRLSLENLDQALYVLSALSDQSFESDRIVWVAALEGKSEIQEKLRERQQLLTQIQGEVRAKRGEIFHEWRGTNLIKLSLITGSLAFPALVPEFEVLSGGSVLYAMYLAYMLKNSSIIANLTAELGLTPIEWSRGRSSYEIYFMEHTNLMNETLENFGQEDLIVFSDRTILSTSQFTAMKNCPIGSTFTDIESVATTCLMQTLNLGDTIFNREVKQILKEEYKKARLNQRWSMPLTNIREVLFSHPKTGEPTLVTGLEFHANFVYPPNKPSNFDQLKEGDFQLRESY